MAKQPIIPSKNLKPAKVSNKDLLAQIVAECNKKTGEGTATRFDTDVLVRSEVRECIPTGLQVLDHKVIGCGGLPVGRGVELYGPEGAGKSAFSLIALANCQKENGLAVLIDTDFSFSRERALSYGIDITKLLLLQPDHLDDMRAQVEIVLKMLDGSQGPNLIVWDQLASTSSKKELDEGLTGDSAMGERAKDLATFYKLLRKPIAEKRVCFITINEIREKFGVKFGDKEDTPGGKAPKHFSSLRLRFSAGALVREGNKPGGKVIGITVYIQCKKNRFGPPRQTVETRLLYTEGWDERWTTITHAKEIGFLEKGARIGNEAYNKATTAMGWENGLLVPIGGDETAEELEAENFGDLPQENTPPDDEGFTDLT